MMFGSRSQRLRRSAILIGVVALGLAMIGGLIARFGVADEPDEAHFGAAAADAAATVYVQPLAVDPVNYSMQIRVDLRRSQSGARDLILTIVNRQQTSQLQLSADRAASEMTLSLDLEGGSVRSYPLDAYTSQISVFRNEGEMVAPIRVTVWGGLFGYDVHSDMPAPGTMLRFSVARTGAVRFFGVSVFGIMIVLAACSLTVGTLVFVGIRKIEVTLVSALGGIIFALPVLRNAMPGTPPLGIQADVLVFFWAEFAAVTGLGLFLVTWVWRGAKP